MPKFVVFFNGEPLKTYEIDEPVVTIGRLPENSITIANMGVSRRHVKIEEDTDRRFMLSDLNSLNGTYVNGKRIKRITLSSGDKISIGKYTILYEETKKSEMEQDSGSYFSMPASNVTQFNPYYDRVTEPRMAMPANDIAIDVHQGATEESGDKDAHAVLIETNKHVVHKLDKPYMTIGSGESDDIFISGFMIGEGQVSIDKRDNGLYISTKKMMSKIKVNGKNVRSHLLKHKDRIEIGSSTFRFMENG